MKKYCITTFGCRLNENDSEKIAGITEKLGFEKTDNYQDADLVIFNTCCVRENAEERLFGKLRRIKKIKRRKRNNYSYWWMHDARKTCTR